MRIRSYLFLLTIFTVLAIHAQTLESNARAFSLSYESESVRDYEGAIYYLEKVPQEDVYPINLRLGWLYYQSNDMLKSKEYYEKAISNKPNSIEAKLGISYPLSAMGEWQLLADVYEEILKVDSANSKVRYNLAYIYHHNFRKNDIALMHAKVAHELYPFDYDINVLLGKIYVKKGNIKAAKKHYRIAHYYDPESIEVKTALRNL